MSEVTATGWMPPVPEFTCDDNGILCIEWYGSKTSVLTVSIDEAELRFSAATARGVTSSGRWELGEQPPEAFYDAYRAITTQAGE